MEKDKRTKLSDYLVIIGLLIMLIMAVAPLLTGEFSNVELMRGLFTAGAFIVLVGRLIGMYHGESLRLKRLHGILIFSALLYCASASMMFIFQGTNNWIAFLTAGIVVQMYATWMIDRETKKTEK